MMMTTVTRDKFVNTLICVLFNDFMTHFLQNFMQILKLNEGNILLDYDVKIENIFFFFAFNI